MRRSLLIAAVLLALPFAANAMQETTWSFENSNVPGRWEIANLTSAVPTTQGLRIQTKVDGRMMRLSEFTYPVEAAILVFDVSLPSEGILLWHRRGSPQDEMVELPFFVTGVDHPELVRIALSEYPQWDPLADRIALVFKAGADITLQQIQFFHWNPVEKLFYALKSFWHMDVIRPYSINFVWGPRFAVNPIMDATMFKSLPPRGTSAEHVLLVLLGLAAIVIFAIWKLQPGPSFAKATEGRRGVPATGLFTGLFSKIAQNPIRTFLTLVVAVWILILVRMDLELLAYALKDYRTYISADEGERLFRERKNFDEFAAAAAPLISDRSRYLFMSADRWPYFGAIRYYTYPAIPVDPTGSVADVDTVVVFDRPDIVVNDRDELTHEGTVLSPPGDVLLRFDDASYVFRIR